MPLARAFNAMAAQLSQRERELVATNDRLTVMASIDMLSGLANRRGFQSRLNLEWLKAQQHHCELSLLMIDVDHFKLYNDTYGHPEGDACLTRLGEALADIAAGTMGFAGRYGGEEFCLLLPNTSPQRALEIGETVRATVQDLGLPHATSSHRTVTVSVGVARNAAERGPNPRRPDRSRRRRPLRRQAPRPKHRGRARFCQAGGRGRDGDGGVMPAQRARAASPP
jgi:diguanylate cyclase (GGDEF)-like protein